MRSNTRNCIVVFVAGTALLSLIVFFGYSHVDNFDEFLIYLILGFPYLSAMLIGTLTAMDAILRISASGESDTGEPESKKQRDIPIIMTALSAVFNIAVIAVLFRDESAAYVILGYPALLFEMLQTVLWCRCVFAHKKRDEEIRVVPVIIILPSAAISSLIGLYLVMWLNGRLL